MLMSMEERELRVPQEQPLIGWRLFRVRRSENGFVLSAPLIHDPDFERFPCRTIDAVCYETEHPAPAPGCRCGLYAAIDGTLDSLSGYLSDSAHDRDLPIYAEVACTGRVFVDSRGVRAQRIEILRLATSASLWPDPGLHAQAVAELSERYRVQVCGLGVVPQWVAANVMPQGAPPEDAAIDLDALLGRLGLRLPDFGHDLALIISAGRGPPRCSVCRATFYPKIRDHGHPPRRASDQAQVREVRSER